MRKQLTTQNTDGKTGYDNPAMVQSRSEPGLPVANGRTVVEGGSENLKTVYITGPTIAPTICFEEKSYEPYDNREVKHPTTYGETLIHMLKASLGTGILAMPDAFHNAGYAVGTIGTLVIGFLCTYTIHILVSTEYELCKRKKLPSMTYPATAQAAVEDGPKSFRFLAPYMPLICNVFLLMYQIGSCCIYVVFISSNIKDVVDYYYPDTVLNIRWYMLMIMVPLVLIGWVRNLKYLAPLSTIANAVTLLSFSIIFYYIFTDIPNIRDRSAVAPFSRMPLFFGTVLFAMEAIGVVMPLENEMKKPQHFGSVLGVLNCAMLPITLLYTFVGFFGYLRYGDSVEGSITLSLPPGQKLAQAARLMLAFAIFVTHALACFVAFDITWREYVERRVTNKKIVAEYILRTFLVLITVALAAAVPDLELFISLIGALCLSTMGLSFPAIIQLLTYWDHYEGAQFVFFFLKNLTIIIIALLGFAIGTTTSLEAIIEEYF